MAQATDVPIVASARKRAMTNVMIVGRPQRLDIFRAQLADIGEASAA